MSAQANIGSSSPRALATQLSEHLIGTKQPLQGQEPSEREEDEGEESLQVVCHIQQPESGLPDIALLSQIVSLPTGVLIHLQDHGVFSLQKEEQ